MLDTQMSGLLSFVISVMPDVFPANRRVQRRCAGVKRRSIASIVKVNANSSDPGRIDTTQQRCKPTRPR
ncbi:hypothetical protein [Bradyrhizobium elkanii]|uniref:hypothetical protein n=1 Tax=Bradyrhizobium elkanii TaxID=29448 RepID=UPI000428842F|nr:hypothetical protein [Bradyrhizobium elkanii]